MRTYVPSLKTLREPYVVVYIRKYNFTTRWEVETGGAPELCQAAGWERTAMNYRPSQKRCRVQTAPEVVLWPSYGSCGKHLHAVTHICTLHERMHRWERNFIRRYHACKLACEQKFLPANLTSFPAVNGMGHDWHGQIRMSITPCMETGQSAETKDSLSQTPEF